MYAGTPQYHTHIHMQNYGNKALLESLIRTIHPFKHYDGSKLSTYHEPCSCSPLWSLFQADIAHLRVYFLMVTCPYLAADIYPSPGLASMSQGCN